MPPAGEGSGDVFPATAAGEASGADEGCCLAPAACEAIGADAGCVPME